MSLQDRFPPRPVRFFRHHPQEISLAVFVRLDVLLVLLAILRTSLSQLRRVTTRDMSFTSGRHVRIEGFKLWFRVGRSSGGQRGRLQHWSRWKERFRATKKRVIWKYGALSDSRSWTEAG